jgi:hypothetical protein
MGLPEKQARRNAAGAGFDLFSQGNFSIDTVSSAEYTQVVFPANTPCKAKIRRMTSQQTFAWLNRKHLHWRSFRTLMKSCAANGAAGAVIGTSGRFSTLSGGRARLIDVLCLTPVEGIRHD